MADTKQDYEAAMARFLANGGKIQQVAANVSGRSEGTKFSAWGAPKKKAGRKPASETPTVDPEDDFNEE